VLLLLFGLLRSGQAKLRAMVGYQDIEVMAQAAQARLPRRQITR
jgi:hypothetical protein